MFAIRDDDTSYWTQTEQLQKLYLDSIEKGLKVSLAVVPKSVETIERGNRKFLYQNNNCHYIYENKKLVEFLKYYIKKGQVEIMLHGYDHSYCVKIGTENIFLDANLRKKVGTTKQLEFVPECIHKSEALLEKQLQEGKQILEDTFETKVRVFVPPSNALSAQTVLLVEKLGLNISGTITNKFNRKIDLYSLSVYLKKAFWKITTHDVSYPKVMKYKRHKELIGYSFTPSTNGKRFQKQYEYCKMHHYPFTLAIHYWELLENNELQQNFYQFLEQVQRAEVAFVSELF